MPRRANVGSVEALVQRLRRSRRQVEQLQALHELLDATASSALAIVASGAVPLLVQHLSGPSAGLQRAAGAILNQIVLEDPGSVAALKDADGLPVVAQRLQSPDDLVQLSAVHLALSITVSGRNAGCSGPVDAFRSSESVGALARCLGSRNDLLRASAGGTLDVLVSGGSPAAGGTAVQLVRDGVLPAVVRLFNTSSECVQHVAAQLLGNLAVGGAECKAAAVAGVPALLEQLSSSNVRIQEAAAHALMQITTDASAEVLEAVAAAGAVAALSSCLGSVSAGAATSAAVALERLSSGGPTRSRAAAATGAVPGTSSQPAGAADAGDGGAARRPRTCSGPGCGAKHGLRLCGGCGTVRYCSEACSRAHWRAHRAECRRLQAEQAADAPQQP